MQEIILHLTLHKQPFDKIASGRKTHEFREVKPYWTERLFSKPYTHIVFTNGYRRGSPRIKAEITTITSRKVKGVPLYVIGIGIIISVHNYKL